MKNFWKLAAWTALVASLSACKIEKTDDDHKNDTVSDYSNKISIIISDNNPWIDLDAIVWNDFQAIDSWDTARFVVDIMNTWNESLKNLYVEAPNTHECGTGINLDGNNMTFDNPNVYNIVYTGVSNWKFQPWARLSYDCKASNINSDFVNTVTVKAYTQDNDLEINHDSTQVVVADKDIL